MLNDQLGADRVFILGMEQRGSKDTLHVDGRCSDSVVGVDPFENALTIATELHEMQDAYTMSARCTLTMAWYGGLVHC